MWVITTNPWGPAEEPLRARVLGVSMASEKNTMSIGNDTCMLSHEMLMSSEMSNYESSALAVLISSTESTYHTNCQ
jgi:hypothetical protein